MRSLERDRSLRGLVLLSFGGDLLLDFRCFTRFLLLSLLLSDDTLLTDSEEDEDEDDEDELLLDEDADRLRFLSSSLFFYIRANSSLWSFSSSEASSESELLPSLSLGTNVERFLSPS